MPDVAIKSDTGRRPPVLSAADNPAEREAFFAYFDEQYQRTPVEAAATEAQRLTSYFQALDKRLTRGGPEVKGGAPKPSSVITFFTPPFLRDHKPRDVYQSGDLTGIFQTIATQTRSIVLAEVAICPESMTKDMTKDRAKDRAFSARPYVHSGGVEVTLLDAYPDDRRGYGFGMFDVRKDSPPAEAWLQKFSSAIGIPVLALNDGMLDAIQPHQPQKLLRPLQDVISLCNHDMMHNMVNTISASNISRPAEASFLGEMARFMEHKTGTHNAADPLGFEGALVVGHARTWQDWKETPAGAQMSQAVEHFYDHLAVIAAGLAKDPALSPEARHRVVDYFAMAVPYALARLVPLHDPLMERALQRAEEIDPLSARALSPARVSDDPRVVQALKNYRKAGTPLAADEKAPESYREAKKLQLARILPDIAVLLSPARKGSPEYKAHARSDEMDRDIVNIIVGPAKSRPLSN